MSAPHDPETPWQVGTTAEISHGALGQPSRCQAKACFLPVWQLQDHCQALQAARRRAALIQIGRVIDGKSVPAGKRENFGLLLAIDRPSRPDARAREKSAVSLSVKRLRRSFTMSVLREPQTIRGSARALRRCGCAQAPVPQPDGPRPSNAQHAAIDASRTNGINICVPRAWRREFVEGELPDAFP